MLSAVSATSNLSKAVGTPMADKEPISLAEYRVLGVRITAATSAQWLSTVAAGVADRGRRVLVSQNLHSAYLAPTSKALQKVQSLATLVRIDGMPLVWIAKLLGLPVTREHRAGFMDLMPLLMAEAAAQGWKVFVIAGEEGVAERAASVLRDQHPNLQISVENGYFKLDDSDNEVSRRLERVNSEGADVLLVGLGMPRQEEFLLRYLDRIEAPVVGTCGAAFDYVAGTIPMAPRWLSAMGLEWLFRLLAEPRRLWRRYLAEPLHLLPRLVTDLRSRRLGVAHYELARHQLDTKRNGEAQ